ncbi:MAG: alkaline phosphatase family protein [Candidatus Omnitrophica bacterium]|nr:alkaline phosphatase family protein [Candidatus Omnitrophota bacterium]
MNRMIILGFDGMDRDVAHSMIGRLPNIASLGASTPKTDFSSIFPPDTTPAWASIYTGMNPAEHGVINFVNAADKNGGYRPFKVEDGFIMGKTFWDELSASGIGVCVVLPMIVSPGWVVKGGMITRSTEPRSETTPLSAFPRNLIKKYSPDPKKLNLVPEFFAKSKLKKLVDTLRARLAEEHRLALTMFDKEGWRCFFAYYSALDEIQHVFWPYYDKNHPLYPGANEFESVIPDFYTEADRMIGEFVSRCEKDDAIMVLSDHGHGPRPSQTVNINEWLRHRGYLAVKERSVRNTEKNRHFKKILGSFIERFGAGGIVMRLAKKFPVWKQIFASAGDIDWYNTKAYVSDLSAVKNYSYGGIRINDTVKTEKNRVIEDIIDSLQTLKDEKTGTSVVKWVLRREKLYNGLYLHRYPEILFELDERYGVGWACHEGLFTNEPGIFQLKPGAHRRRTPILFTKNISENLFKEQMTLTDIAPIIKKSFGI